MLISGISLKKCPLLFINATWVVHEIYVGKIKMEMVKIGQTLSAVR